MNTESGQTGKVFTLGPESLFTFGRIRCSRWTGLGVHDGPEYAVVSDLKSVEALGDQVPFNCPDCGGVLWQMKHGAMPRYRCHTGHAFSQEALLAQQNEKIEETLWVALRMFEERQNLISTMGGTQKDLSSSLRERVEESQIHIDRIRQMLKATDGNT